MCPGSVLFTSAAASAGLEPVPVVPASAVTAVAEPLSRSCLLSSLLPAECGGLGYGISLTFRLAPAGSDVCAGVCAQDSHLVPTEVNSAGSPVGHLKRSPFTLRSLLNGVVAVVDLWSRGGRCFDAAWRRVTRCLFCRALVRFQVFSLSQERFGLSLLV
jgi:hypothetical protein